MVVPAMPMMVAVSVPVGSDVQVDARNVNADALSGRWSGRRARNQQRRRGGSRHKQGSHHISPQFRYSITPRKNAGSKKSSGNRGSSRTKIEQIHEMSLEPSFTQRSSLSAFSTSAAWQPMNQ
jgi:hypothetical protein